VQKFNIKSFAVSYGMTFTVQSVISIMPFAEKSIEFLGYEYRKGRFPLPLSSWYSSMNPRSVCWIYVSKKTQMY
jgi:hypothetical protein